MEKDASPTPSSSNPDRPPSSVPPAPSALLAALALEENDVSVTIGQGGHRIWLYPREILGYFTRRRTWVAYLLMLLYLGTPWLRWQGEQALLVDVFDRKLVLLGHYFFPQDLRLFLPGIFGSVLLVFLITATWGRIWCGWACPQTVFLQFIFGPLERLIEGKAAIRQKRDAGSLSWDWLWRKVVKHVLYYGVALVISNTALSYFWGTSGVMYAMSQPPSENWSGFLLVFIFATVFYWVFAYFREQACVIVCPYARFQSVLLDEKTKVVAYDAKRGEPRGRGAQRESLGDCVDCKQCILVCPTGIDIRHGNQLECIGCTRCIDACDQTMTAWKKPEGLIRYASLRDLQAKDKGKIRIRPFVYAGLASILLMICAFLLYNRPHVAVDILRRGAEPYQRVGQDSILNTYTLHLRNKDIRSQICTIRFAEPMRGRHNWEGRPFSIGSGEIKTLPIDIVVARDEFAFGKREVSLVIEGGDKVNHFFKTTLVGPFGN